MDSEAASIRLRIRESSGRETDFSFSGQVMRLGRDPGSELAFADEGNEAVSWNHALFELTDAGVYVVDCGSRNGTFLAGSKLTQRTLVRRGDAVRLGTTGPEITMVDVSLPSSKRVVVAAQRHAAHPAAVAPAAEPPRFATAQSAQPAELPRPESRRQRSPIALVAVLAGLLGVFAVGLVVVLLQRGSGEVAGDNLPGKHAPRDAPEVPNRPGREAEPAKPKTEPEDPSVEVTEVDPAPVPPKPKSEPNSEPKPPPSKPKIQTLTPEEISNRWRENVFWVGGVRGDVTIPCCTAWAVRPNVLVTAASNLDFLRLLAEHGYALSVATDAGGKNMIGVSQMRAHPSYGTGNSANVKFGVAVLSVQEPLPTARQPAVHGSPEPPSEPAITVLGFSLPSDDGKPVPLSESRRAGYQTVTGKLLPNPTAGVHAYRVTADMPESLNGAPVFSSEGNVIGVLDFYEECVVPGFHLKDLLE